MSQRKTKDPELTYKRAAELLRYDPGTGRIFWRVSRGPAAAGDEAGRVKQEGRRYYRQIKVDGRHYYTHRIAWLLSYGCWPDAHIDHRDGDGLNNRIGNLRDADGATNMRNASMNSHNTSGVNGVTWHKQCGKWQVQVRLGGVNKYIGLFDELAEATAARAAANIKYGFTARHGIRSF